MSYERQNQVMVRTGYGVPAADGTQQMRAPINHGCIPGSRLAASVNPTANDIAVTIGGIQFKVVAALAAAAAFVQVFREATAAATYSNLVDAINGKASNAGVKWLEATTPFAATVAADMVQATQLRLRFAPARGGLPLPGVSGSLALLAAVTAGATAWSKANLNVDGKSPADCDQAYGVHAVTAAEITAGFVDIELDFQPTMQDIYATSAAGVLKTISDTVSIPANQKSLHFTVGGGTALVAGDLIYWWVGV